MLDCSLVSLLIVPSNNKEFSFYYKKGLLSIDVRATRKNNHWSCYTRVYVTHYTGFGYNNYFIKDTPQIFLRKVLLETIEWLKRIRMKDACVEVSNLLDDL